MTNIFSLLITRPMGFIIEAIYTLIPNYGVAIILFTILIKAIIFPLTYKSQKSMIKQQRISPLLQELQKKYADDKEKLSAETMKLYKENNVSMTGGCLPLLLQFPIIIGLYRVIMKPLQFVKAINIDDQSIKGVTQVLVNSFPDLFNAKYKITDILANSQIQLSKAAQNLLADPEKLKMVKGVSVSSDQVMHTAHRFALDFNFLGIDLSRIPSDVTKLFTGQTHDLSILFVILVPLIATLLTWLTTKLQQSQTKQYAKKPEKPKRYTGKEPEKDTTQTMTNTMNIMMPAMTAIFTFTMPAGIGFYWITSSAVQIAQQYFMNKHLNKKEGEIVVNQLDGKQSAGAGGKKKRKKR